MTSTFRSSYLRRMTLLLSTPTQTARLSSTYIARPLLSQPSVPTPFRKSLSLGGSRYKSTQPRNKWAEQPIVTYDELKPITQQPNDDILLIDVREPDEVKLGSIPSAVNLPLSVLRDALDSKTSEGEFQQKYAFPKPTTSQQIIFFCRSGKRSASAAEWAEERGYPNVRNYAGSWLDWSAREKRSSEDDD